MKKIIQVMLFITFAILLLYGLQTVIGQQFLGILSVIFSILAVLTGFVIFLENRHPTKTITWLIVLGVFPIVGFIFYILFGRNVRKNKLFQEKAMIDERTFLKIEGTRFHTQKIPHYIDEHQIRLYRLAQRLGKSPVSSKTYSEVLTNGDGTFSKILEVLKEANNHIHLEYYIVRDDKIGCEIKDILIEKAMSGVEVRFLYDAVGSWKLSKEFIQDLIQAGVEIVPFSPVRLAFLNHKVNFRNHRKIIVVDGKKGFVGGLNIGDEYLGRNEHFGFWRDTHLYIHGEAVRSLQLIFLQDWYYMTGETMLTTNYLSPSYVDTEGNGGVQLISGGPDNEWEVIKNIFFEMIASAKKSISIATPYLIPDVDILSALKIASLAGIDVKIIIPKRPDKKIVFYASRSYFPELLEAGVRVYEYEKGFMHSKFLIIDDDLASIGTSNLDMRSFHLNFEVNAYLYQSHSIKSLVLDFQEDLAQSTEIDYGTFSKRPLRQRLFESLSRLLSPLL
ncbi:cardiolipin synthase [Bacillus suaedaesalsae]|uniref:Cardiolipin synthase n=1 Tax=Bacillus suaedaesalsae TaxID=2810349 RepID=A0ABS2DIE1_9BACI|nr:cardiolipin synthase [Bacillus suaedaesalsae]MBM6618272.1 cardiolipin synthase [Bacillus suaedaesalsae]